MSTFFALLPGQWPSFLFFFFILLRVMLPFLGASSGSLSYRNPKAKLAERKLFGNNLIEDKFFCCCFFGCCDHLSFFFWESFDCDFVLETKA